MGSLHSHRLPALRSALQPFPIDPVKSKRDMMAWHGCFISCTWVLTFSKWDLWEHISQKLWSIYLSPWWRISGLGREAEEFHCTDYLCLLPERSNLCRWRQQGSACMVCLRHPAAPWSSSPYSLALPDSLIFQLWPDLLKWPLPIDSRAVLSSMIASVALWFGSRIRAVETQVQILFKPKSSLGDLSPVTLPSPAVTLS